MPNMGGGGGMGVIQSSAPLSPTAGSLWSDTDDNTVYRRSDDESEWQKLGRAMVTVTKTDSDVSGAAIAVYTLPQDQSLNNVFVEITEAFNVGLSVSVGDAADEDGFLESSSFKTTGLKEPTRGVYITGFKTMRSISGDTVINAYFAPEAFSAGADMTTGLVTAGSGGTMADGIFFGGNNAGVTTTLEYDGSSDSWSAGGALSTARFDTTGGATSSSNAICIGGISGTTRQTSTEEYNGTAWGSGGAIATARGMFCGAGGKVEDAFIAGGYLADGSNSAVTENYNGSSWSTGGSLSAATRAGSVSGSSGLTSAGMCGGGHVAANVATCQTYNATAWSITDSLSAAKYALSLCGNSSNSLATGGNTGSTVATAEIYNGSTFSATGSLTSGRYNHASAGNSTNAVVCGGECAAGTNNTERFDTVGSVTAGSATFYLDVSQ